MFADAAVMPPHAFTQHALEQYFIGQVGGKAGCSQGSLAELRPGYG